MSKLECAYKRLDVEEYISAIKDSMVALYDDYDGEFLTLAQSGSVFKISACYCDDLLMGYNIYVNGILVDTKSTKKKARKYLKRLMNSLVN